MAKFIDYLFCTCILVMSSYIGYNICDIPEKFNRKLDQVDIQLEYTQQLLDQQYTIAKDGFERMNKGLDSLEETANKGFEIAKRTLDSLDETDKKRYGRINKALDSLE